MFFSQFTCHFAANRASMPKAIAEDIRRRAVARLVERQRAVRADGPLLFDDLVGEIEDVVSGRR